MSNNCNHPTCYDSPTCRREKKPKKRYFLKPFSNKRTIVNKEQYAPKRDAYIISNPVCKINSPVCTGKTTCVNHTKGKATIALLLDERWWEPSCTACNNFIEIEDAWARSRGHKKNHNGN